jgi:hypothetical protein
MAKFDKFHIMHYSVEDLDDVTRFHLFLSISYNDLAEFVINQLKKRSFITLLFWFLCLLSFTFSVVIRFSLARHFAWGAIIKQSLIGFILLPVLCIPVHEGLHILPFALSGARNIRVGMDLKQYLFFVTAHRYVAGKRQFTIVALMPFLLITAASIAAIIILPPPWKWSVAAFLFAHTTMCAGDFALISLFNIKGKKIYTWDDADKRMAYFYEEV